MPFLEDALTKFELLDPEVVFIVNSDRVIEPLQELAERYETDFNDVVIMMVTGDLKSEDLVDYLVQEKQMLENKAKSAAAELTTLVLEPLTKRLLFMNADPDRDKETIRLEKEHLKEIFAQDLLAEFKEHPFIRNALNFKIFDLLERDFSLKMELERALYENKELLTTGKIKLNSRSVDPTVGNWLKDFLKKTGNDNFNTVILSDYLANGENAKKLNTEERAKLVELLLLYQNVRFFEEMVKDKKMDDWRIFPVSLEELKKQKQSVLEKPKTVTASTASASSFSPALNEAKQKLSQYDWPSINGLERRALLDELGVTPEDFKVWYNNNYGQ
jgi:hypothetical protein